MGREVSFTNNSIRVKKALDVAIEAYLHEASGEVVSETARRSPVKTGQLKNSWAANIHEEKNEAEIGSPLENAIWNEFGTGEFASKGNGRKGGWVYKDEKTGKFVRTRGKPAQRTLEKAFKKLKPKLKRRAEEVLKARMK